MPYNMAFAFVDRVTGVVKYDGLILLRMMIEISKPDTVIGIRDIDLELDTIILHPGCGNDINKCISHPQQCCITHTHTALSTSANSNSPFSFDTDGISFIINNSATCIICNQRDLFVGRLSSEKVSMTTCEGDTVKQRYIGNMQLILTDDSNVDHSYDIPNCIFDPNSPVNIVGIPVMDK